MDIENMSIPERLMAAVDCLKADKDNTRYVRAQLRLMSRNAKLEKLKNIQKKQAERAAKIDSQIAEQIEKITQAKTCLQVAKDACKLT